MKIFCLLITVGLAMGFVPKAAATIDATLQMQLGNPSGAIVDTNNHSHYLIQRSVEALDYNDSLGEPNWVSWDLTASDIGSSGRSSTFFTDTNLPSDFYWVTPDDYDGVGTISFDRGHMCPSEDRTDNVTDNDMVFFMSNIIPQAANNNEGVWGNFETYCRSLAQSSNELLIICGPSGFGGSRIPSGKAAISDYTWKIAVVVPAGSGMALSRITTATRVIAVNIPNNNSVGSAWQNYVTSASQIQINTGFSFFTALPTNVAAALLNKVDGQTNPPPVITSFSPTNGGVGDAVIITGSNFTSTTTVSFNGVNAAFVISADTQISATVPTNAHSGPISVTAGGTAVSAGSFIVSGSSADLAIGKSHTGNFTQGDTNDSYIISVANVGSVATSDIVTVTDLLPAGLTVTSMSGDGWTVNSNLLSCTRTDALSAGASYPFLTVTVSVAANAPGSLTNSATVSTSGDTNSLNNVANDVTTILTATSYTNPTTLFGWDVSGLAGGVNNFGISPLPPTSNAPTFSVSNLTRGSGIGTSGSAAARAWGGEAFTATSEAAAITANQVITFGGTVTNGYTVSYTSISKFSYRRSGTGPAQGVLQYQLGAGAFTDITALAYTNSASTGAALSPINLSGIASLQNVGAGTNVIFRIVNYGGGSSGTWYIFDVTNTTPLDLEVQGVVAPVVKIPAIAPTFSLLNFASNQFQFTITGTSGSSYIVQSTTNLSPPNWIPIATNAAPFRFTDTNLSSQMFYRALVAP